VGAPLLIKRAIKTGSSAVSTPQICVEPFYYVSRT
jgi:hypothetical protein